jgi:integrase
MAKRKGSLWLSHDSWYLKTYINGKQRAYRLGHKRDFISKDEIHAAADRKLLELRQVTAGSMARIPLDGFVDKWYLVTGDWRPSTKNGYRKMWKRYINGEQWAQRPLWEYQTRDVQDVLRSVSAKYNLSKQTLRHFKAFLSGIFRAAIIAGFRETNPVRDTKVPRSAKPGKEVGVYSLAEVEATLAALAPLPIAHCAFAIAAYAGLRLAEIQGLDWTDIDLRERTIEVRRTRWRTFESDAKSAASRNWVPITAKLAVALEAYGKDEQRSGPLFNIGLSDYTDREMKPRLRHAKVQWKGWHAARRGLASNLFELGVDDLTVSRILRHSGVQVTRDHYIRSRDKRMTEAMAQLEKGIIESSG